MNTQNDQKALGEHSESRKTPQNVFYHSPMSQNRTRLCHSEQIHTHSHSYAMERRPTREQRECERVPGPTAWLQQNPTQAEDVVAV
jgi:hypothetical protein